MGECSNRRAARDVDKEGYEQSADDTYLFLAPFRGRLRRRRRFLFPLFLIYGMIKMMKVIFIKDISGVARKNETKDVAEGYARNFLLPRGFAIPATNAAVAGVEREKAHKAAEIEKKTTRFREYAKELSETPLVFKVKIGEKGKAFGSVGPAKIVDALKRRGIIIDKSWLSRESLKTVGEHKIIISFLHGVKMEARVIIEPEDH